MFARVLVANRGEIALRIIRACRELGVESIAVYSEADVDSMHVQLADDAVCIGPGPGKESYLKPDRIIAAAEIMEADAIHPGYGFLSENARFAEICESCNIKFIGPSAEVIRTMGDKNTARATALANGVPVTPGSDGIVAKDVFVCLLNLRLLGAAAVSSIARALPSRVCFSVFVARLAITHKIFSRLSARWFFAIVRGGGHHRGAATAAAAAMAAFFGRG